MGKIHERQRQENRVEVSKKHLHEFRKYVRKELGMNKKERLKRKYIRWLAERDMRFLPEDGEYGLYYKGNKIGNQFTLLKDDNTRFSANSHLMFLLIEMLKRQQEETQKKKS